MAQHQKPTTENRSSRSLGQENGSQSGASLAPPSFALSASPVQMKQEDPNAILGDLTTTGAGAKTTKQDGKNYTDVGVKASQRMAKTDQNRILKYADLFKEVAASYGLPPALLAAIASRETRGKNLLEGDGGNGVGMMQVDVRFHPEKAKAIRNAKTEREQIKLGIVYGAQILKKSLDDVKKKHPTWSKAWQLRGAVAAYNFGVKNVGTQGGLDKGSTGDDYSADVWARAKYYAQFKEFGSSAEVKQAATASPKAAPAKKAAPSTNSSGWGDTFSGMLESAQNGLEYGWDLISSAWGGGESAEKTPAKPAAVSQAATGSLAKITLSGKVGVGGVNKASDVWQVQAKLQALGYLTGAGIAEATAARAFDRNKSIPEGKLKQTIAAIVAFQADQTSGFAPDGSITPGLATHTALNKNVHKSKVKKTGTSNESAGAGKVATGAKTPQVNKNYSVDKAVAKLNANALASSSGYCAKYVRLAIMAGGAKLANWPGSAKDYKGYLEKYGFKQVPGGSPQKGDIVVMQGFKGVKKNHPHGHIQMYNGSVWVSDFKQNGFWPGGDYRTAKPGNVTYRMQ